MISGQYFGKYTGVVEDNSDADKLGQIEVSVPSIFAPGEKVQARAALPYGYFFVPEKQARVWVEFEGGDPGLPLWTGIQMMQSADWASEAAVDPPQKRVIKTAAGHVVIFDDTSGQEGIELKDGANGHKISLNSSGVSIEFANGAKIQLAQSGITIDAGTGSVTVTGNQIDLSGAQVNLGQGAALGILRPLIDQAVGNLGAPVVLTGPGTGTVKVPAS
jgi:type VI secretion system (T6SS) baseplate-like injector VgrG